MAETGGGVREGRNDRVFIDGQEGSGRQGLCGRGSMRQRQKGIGVGIL